MNLIARGLFVVGGIAVGSFLINHFVFGNTGDALIRSDRIGEWRKAAVREACFPAMEYPERDTMAPKMPAGQHRVSASDHRRAVELTVATESGRVISVSEGLWSDNEPEDVPGDVLLQLRQ